MTDYYELLGVEPDAGRDEIKAAYQERRATLDAAAKAELNRAWNVLSDPIQRERYDAKFAEGEVQDDGGGDVEVVPAKRATGARRAAERPAARPRPEPTIVLPAGMEFATPKARSMALAFDFAVLVLIAILCQQFVPPLVSSNYHKALDRYNHQVSLVDKAQKVEDKANASADKADAAAKKADKSGDVVAAGAARGQARHARDEAAGAAADRKHAQDAAAKIGREELQGPGLAAVAITALLALLYSVPMSAVTGQTVGKRLRRITLVRVDGLPAGWGASLAHYAVPIVLTLALFYVLQVLALIAGLGMVLWNLRDRNRQGLHDKLAKTLVVAVPPAGG